MDFIDGLPKSFGKEVIFVVVDRFSKYAHFSSLSHPYTAIDVAQAYLDHVFKLHGWPQSIISDRDKVFSVISGRLHYPFKVQLCSCQLLTTLRQMAKQKWSTDAWKHTLGVCVMRKPMSGVNGCPSLNGGTILPFTQPLSSLPTRWCIINPLQCIYLIFLGRLKLMQWIGPYRGGKL